MSDSTGEARRWFYVREGRRHGPVETTRLVDLVLGGEVSEDALVWHSGLPEWRKARDVEEISHELPPPVPSTPAPPPPDPVPKMLAEEGEPSATNPAPGAGEAARTEPSGPADLEDLSNGQKKRRKRKHRHRDSKRRPPWLWPLAVVLVGLMIFLWWLLRRMNEVPPGRIIQTGSFLERPRGTRLDLAVARLVPVPKVESSPA